MNIIVASSASYRLINNTDIEKYRVWYTR